MALVQTWADTTMIGLQDLWQTFLAFIPQLLGAFIVFIVGWFIAIGVGRLVSEVLNRVSLISFLIKQDGVKLYQKPI